MVKYIVVIVISIFCWSSLLAQNQDQNRFQAEQYFSVADSLLNKRELSKAINFYKEADSLFLSIGDKAGSYKCQYGIMYTYLRLGDSQETMKMIDQTLENCEKDLGSNSKILGKLNYLDGLLDMQFKEGQETVAKAMKAIRIFESHGHETMLDIANCYNIIGVSKYRQKDYTRALEFYTKSLDIKKEILGESHPSLGTNYNNIGIIYAATDKPQKAIEYYEKSLQIKIKKLGPDHPTIADSQFNIGQVYTGLEEYEKALPYTLEAIRINRINEERTNFKLAHRLTSLSMIYFYLGESKKAESIGIESIAYYEKSESGNFFQATGYQSLGSLYYLLHDYPNSLKQYQMALEVIAGDSWVMDTSGNPVVTDSLKSDRLYQIFSRKTRLLDAWYEKNDSLDILKTSLATKESMIETVRLLQLDIEDDQSSLEFSEDIRDVYESAIRDCSSLYSLTNDNEYVDKGFQIYTESKSALLRKELRKEKAEIDARIPEDLQEEYASIHEEINTMSLELAQCKSLNRSKELRDSIFDLKYRTSELEIIFEKQYPTFSEIILSKDDFDSKSFTSKAKVFNKKFIAWFYGKENIYAFHNFNSDLECVKLEKDSTLQDKLISFSGLIKDNIRAESQGNSKELFDIFRKEALDIYSALFPRDIEFGSSVIVIPDGLINLVPIEILLYEEADAVTEVDYSNLHYLLRHTSFRYAYSPHFIDFETGAKEKTNAKGILATSPTYDTKAMEMLAMRDGFTALVYAAEETSFLHEEFNASLLVGTDITDEDFIAVASDFSILHLAMHAYTNDENPEYSGLIFSSEEDPKHEDNLHSFEISSLKLEADLVVLSACNTGGGKIAAGEGTMSLARSFMQAGSDNILMSLWQVDDKATSIILKEFYTNLEASQGKDMALRNAKLSYISNNKKNFPFYWSAFVLLGDDEPISLVQESKWQKGALFAMILAGILILGFLFMRKKQIS